MISSFNSITLISIKGVKVSTIFWLTNSSEESSQIFPKLSIIELDKFLSINEFEIIFSDI